MCMCVYFLFLTLKYIYIYIYIYGSHPCPKRSTEYPSIPRTSGKSSSVDDRDCYRGVRLGFTVLRLAARDRISSEGRVL